MATVWIPATPEFTSGIQTTMPGFNVATTLMEKPLVTTADLPSRYPAMETSLPLVHNRTTAMASAQVIHAFTSGIQTPIPGFNAVVTSMVKRQVMKVAMPSHFPAMEKALQ